MQDFLLKDDSRPKRVARALQSEFERLRAPRTHVQCLDIVAEFYGHRTWRELKPHIGKGRPSPLDHASDDLTVAARRDHQRSVLLRHGVPAGDVEAVLDRVRPTASHSPKRVGDTAGRFTYLDLPRGKYRPMEQREGELFTELFARELQAPRYKEGIDWDSRLGRLLIEHGPEQRRALCTRLAEVDARVTLGPVIFAAGIMRFRDEPMIWADTLKEMQRRTVERLTLRLWAENDFMPHGLPSDDGIGEAVAFRSVSEKSTGYPMHRHTIEPGEIGLLISLPGADAFSARLPVRDLGRFEAETGPLVLSQFPEAVKSQDAFSRAQLDLVDSYRALVDDPEVPDRQRMEGIICSFMLWLVLHHPRAGERLRQQATQMARSGGSACITLNFVPPGRFVTSLGPTYADISGIAGSMPAEVLRAVEEKLGSQSA